MYRFDRGEYERRMAWFTQARFGMFIHFGLYALPGRGEWVRSDERMPEEEYMPFFRRFDPRRLDMGAWARAAREAGMGYAVLTAKHHDGFCLFDSALTDFKSVNTPCGRDIVREFLEAFRAEGLKVGLYYSLLDWHHPDYPHFGDRYHPLRDDPAADNTGRDWERYLDYMHGQVRELCTRYGKLDLMWFDFSYGDMTGPKWRAAELADTVRTLQPGIVLNNRLEASGEGFGSLYTGRPTPWHGDFVTPEKMIPPAPLRDEQGMPLVWESCVTMNNSWGYTREDRYYKPAGLLVKKLVECVSRGGNMILNVGPDETGRFPAQAEQILGQMGRWMARCGESIRGCGPAELPKPDCGRFTRRGDTLYLHVFENALGPLPVPGLDKDRVRAVTCLADGRAVKVSASWVHSDWPQVCFLDLGPDPVLPDATDTVLRIELEPA